MGGAGRLQPQLIPRGSWDACPLQRLTLVPSVKNPNRVTASRPLLSQPVLAGFSKVCSCLLPAQPHPRAGPAVRPASLGTRAASRLQLSKRRSQFRHLQHSIRLPSRVAKLGSFKCALPLISPSPGSSCPCFPRSFHPEQPVPAGWRFAPLSSPPSRQCCSGASSWQCKVVPRGALSCCQRSRDPARIETRFVPTALQLAGALDLPAGSCTFEENTCGFDSVFEFLPWILNEEGHYIYVDTSFAKQGEKAVLLSPDLQAEEWSCLRLVYQIATSSGSPSDPSRLNLYMRFEDESFDRLFWSAKEPSDSWLIASLDLQNSSQKFKILIEGVLGHGNTSSIALFEIKMTTGYCIECDFEENHLCGFVNHWNPNVNWFVGGGNTRNSNSSLPQDHTLKSELGHYMYVDSIYVKHFQEVAQLISPMTTAPMSGCLSFYYQLQQRNDNIFSVYTRDAAGLYEEIWKAGDPGNAVWNLAEAEFSAPYPKEVIFEVAFNGPKGGYVALDDISFSPVHCQNQTERPFSALEASCNFEEDLCNFYQDKEGSGWTRVKVKPNLYRAGDHTSGLGYFLLADTKFTSQPGYIGRLYGPSLPGNQQYCLRFYYAISGFLKMSDTLAVYIFEENHVVQDKIWSVLESPRGVWMQAEITFRKPMPTKVVFMSLCKSLWDCGLVALDDITIELGSCWSPEKLLLPPGECTFEQDECIFTQERRNRSSWQRRRGETPTSYTGPKGDHTTGVGYYMYIEASHLVYGQKARLLSRPLRGVTGKHCLTFFYHMYGAGTGLLNVYLKKEGNSEESLLWRRRGEQSISWLRALIEYSCERQHQIIIEAIRGMSVRSDIAIDDIKFQAGSCAEMEDKSQQSSGYSEDLNEIEY